MSPDNDVAKEAPAEPGLEQQVPDSQGSSQEEPTVPSLQNRFKAESPRIPGVGELQTKRAGITPKQLAVPAAVVLLIAGLLIYWAVTRPRAGNVKAAAPAELQLPAEASAPTVLIPEASSEQVIASVAEMQKVWTSKEFMYHDALSVLNKPAMLVRLPKGSATQSAGYWAFAMNAAYGDCKLEYRDRHGQAAGRLWIPARNASDGWRSVQPIRH